MPHRKSIFVLFLLFFTLSQPVFASGFSDCYSAAKGWIPRVDAIGECNRAGSGFADCYKDALNTGRYTHIQAVDECKRAAGGFDDCYSTALNSGWFNSAAAVNKCNRAGSGFLDCFTTSKPYYVNQSTLKAIAECDGK